MSRPSKYALYEHAVQGPRRHAEMLVAIYRELRGKYARHLREDFCGTFALACEWVWRNKRNTATGVDIDPEPLRYGKRVHRTKLSAEQKKRLKIRRRSVLTEPAEKSDLVVVGNFSFFLFKKRTVLVDYLRLCLKSLRGDGIVVLEMAGGPGMIQKMKERKSVRFHRGRRYTYVWDQKSFDPITHSARYAIHFGFPDGAVMENAFTYDWRVWTIPEVRDAMADAGFRKTCVYWETTHRGEGTGEYTRSETGDNAYSWIAHVVGLKG